jgi:dTDP-4-dehydrorhamnose reductase
MTVLLVLGSSGMIGSGVLDFFSNLDLEVVESNRSGQNQIRKNKVIKFDILSSNLDSLFAQVPRNSIILNLSGIIRHKISNQNQKFLDEVTKVNGEFPLELVKKASENDCKVVQIATDCVFSGSIGKYIEGSHKDALDFYGISKIKGEIEADNLMTIRVSVVGKERQSHFELMDWVLNQEFEAEVNGYRNHYWNGITSLQFGRVLEGIIKKSFVAGTFHLVPADKVSKFELVTFIARHGGRKDLKIQEFEDIQRVDRTLSTQYPELNTRLWFEAGYPTPPTIEDMIREYFDWKEQKIGDFN